MGPDGRPWHSWRVLLLPYLGQQELYDAYDFSEPWDGPDNRKLAKRMPELYAFHGAYRPGNTTANYLAVVGPETVWPGSQTVTSEDVSDGWSTTILLVENLGSDVHWMEPRDLTFADADFAVHNPRGISSPHEEPAVVTLSGSPWQVNKELTAETLRALLTIQGGERLTETPQGWKLLPDGRQRPLRRVDNAWLQRDIVPAVSY
jgi:hypothetical protein